MASLNEAIDFQTAQKVMTAHMRDPLGTTPPSGIEDRRLAIYRDLIFNNIESFLSNGFPVLKSLISADDWLILVRNFIAEHTCQSPYFLEISQEFLTYLSEKKPTIVTAMPFALELAHYEWVELALDVSPEQLPPEGRHSVQQPPDKEHSELDLLDCYPQVSPLVWRLSYQYPVHKIGREYIPQVVPGEPTYLVVYRNRDEQVNFLEVNAVTMRLIQLLEEDRYSGREALQEIAREINHPDTDGMLNLGLSTLLELQQLSIICGTRT